MLAKITFFCLKIDSSYLVGYICAAPPNLRHAYVLKEKGRKEKRSWVQHGRKNMLHAYVYIQSANSRKRKQRRRRRGRNICVRTRP
jgi:hypothetical protein